MSRAVITTYSEIPARVGVRYQYNPAVNERLKDHGGLWDPERRTWHVPRASLAAVIAILEAEFSMTVKDDTGYITSSRRPDPVSVDRTSFYERMFSGMSETDAKRKHRDLLRAFHPDSAGDQEEAKAINAAYDRVRGRNQRRGA